MDDLPDDSSVGGNTTPAPSSGGFDLSSLSSLGTLATNIAGAVRGTAQNTNGQTVKAPGNNPTNPGSNNIIIYAVLGVVALLGLIFAFRK